MSDTQDIQPSAPEESKPKRYNLFYTGGIYPQSVNNIRGSFIEAVKENAASVNFYLSSSGGELDSALSLYHFLRALPIPLTIHNVGTVDSAAVMVYMAADTRLAVPDSWFLLHSMMLFGNSPIDAPRLLERSRGVDRFAEVYAKIVEERAKSVLNIYEILRGDTSSLIIDPDKALETGIITGIAPVEAISVDDVNISIST